jgi:feruloyl esterase
MPGITAKPLTVLCGGALLVALVVGRPAIGAQESAAGPAPTSEACRALASASLPNTTVTVAEFVPSGAFQAPAGRGRGGGGGNPFADLPAFCRVGATLAPSSDSDIRMEVWMPVTGWNGKLRGTGNGGLGGGADANPGALAGGVRLGYATVGSNTGHEAGDNTYALDHPEKIIDFGYRSAHEMTVTAKTLMTEFYGTGPRLSYMSEGGGGTIAALSSAQRYPEDYDAVAVRGMSSYLTRHVFGQMWVWQATHQDEASYIPPAKYPVIHEAVLQHCDADDGLEDGVVGNPARCDFDPGAIRCQGADGPRCLTAAQVEAARKIYSGPTNPRTGERIYSPLYPGSELTWGQLAGGEEPIGIPVNFFKYFVFQDPDWDYRTRPINFDGDVALSDRPDLAPTNAVDPNLGPFFERGGKLLLIDGWSDTTVPPRVALNYYNAVVKAVGPDRVRESMRFFMVPGMGHGPGTDGPHNFTFAVDPLRLVEEWKENGNPPDRLIVNHYRDGRQVGQRLVCQYPLVAMYRGSGDPEEPSSYECRRF